jgi:ubiquinone biosynthesis protein
MGPRLASLNRARRIAQTFVRHGLGSLLDQFGLADAELVGELAPASRPVARLGRRLALALSESGPTFVKLGQSLASREDLTPRWLAAELARLHDQAQPIPLGRVRAAVRRAFGTPVEQLYSYFDPEPLAAASIAQVHRARTWAGAEVVVKIRRPGIGRVVEQDLELMLALAERLAERVPEIARFDPVGFVREFGDCLRGELDLEREAEAMTELGRALAGAARVPAVVPSLSNRRVLTMEWIDGGRVTAADDDDRQRAARRVVVCFATQYLHGRLFHADPHPGNVLWGRDRELALIDLGATGRLDAGMRRLLWQLAAAADRRDGRLMADVLLATYHLPADLDRAAYREDMGRFLDELLARPPGTTNAAQVTRDGLGITRRYGLRLRTEYFLLMRSVVLLDGVLRQLDPRIDPIAVTRQHIVRSCFTSTWCVTALRIVASAAWIRLRRVRWPRRHGVMPFAAAMAAIVLFAVVQRTSQGEGATGPGEDGPASTRAETKQSSAAGFAVDAGPAGARFVSLRRCPLRPGPRRTLPVIATVPAGTEVVMGGKTRYYQQVRLVGGEEGYVPIGCVAPGP